MLRTFVLYVADRPGVLDRVASLFRRRAFNIEALHVARTERAGISRMLVEVRASDDEANRLIANIHKLYDVVSVTDITLSEQETSPWHKSSTTPTRT
ncbi:MAG TPA: acetolactate synthase small subunit [Polyangia bacterium]|jgi:acetolactate synthase-1/3 small subunit